MTPSSRVFVGACVGASDSWEHVARPSVENLGAFGVLTRRDARSISVAYNSLIDEANASGATGLVLIHDDVELLAPLSQEFLELLDDDTVSVVGAVGGRSPEGMSWWTGPPEGRFGSSVDSFDEHRFSGGTQSVDVLDGFILGLSRWTLRNLRFDESLIRGFHGYDADICAQARAAGKRVLVTDIEAKHHNKRGIGNLDAYFAAEFAWRLKWQQAPTSQKLLWRVRRDLHRLRGRIKPRDLAVSTPLPGAGRG